MWKYIIISSFVFIGASFYFYTQNHKGLVQQDSGEITHVFKRMGSAVSNKIDAKQQEINAAYSKLREEYYTSEVEREAKVQKEAEAQAADFKSEGDDLKSQNDDLLAETETVERNLKDVVSKTAEVVGLDANSSEPSEIIAAAKDLMDANAELQNQIDMETAQIASLGEQSDDLNTRIAAAQKLGKDRQNSISPPELKCRISYVDPNYSFFALDAGIDNGGVVIGSELAVMRGGKQICVLKVTNVESKVSTATVKKGTMLIGERVKLGDEVISIRNDK